MIGLHVSILFTLFTVSIADVAVKCPDVENKNDVTFVYNSKCYHYIENKEDQVTYVGAEQDCIQREGHLITIKDNCTQTEIVNQLQFIADSYSIIIGLKRFGNEWKWIKGESLSFTNWESNSYCNGTCDCARLNLSIEGRWERFGCETPDWFTAYVCEYGTSGCRLNQGHLLSAFVFAMFSIMTKLCEETL